MKVQSVVYCLVIVLLFSHCSEQGCNPVRNNVVTIGLFKLDTKATTSVAYDSVYLDNPSHLIYKDTSIGILHIPMPYDKDSVFLFLKTKNVAKKDTVLISFQRVFYVVSPDCGYDMKVTNLSVAKATFPKTEIALKNVLLDINATNPQIHIKFFKK